MKLKLNLATIAALSYGSLGLLPAHSADMPRPAKPNVVILLADDLGWGDLGIHKGSIPTPNIDHLFREGWEFCNFMGYAVCSPSRAMLLTGRHPFRVGTGPATGGELEAAETTIAEGFKANGYATGIFGKWHNGEDPDTPEFRSAFTEAFKNIPNKKILSGLGVNVHGFDEAWVYYGGGADYFSRRTVGGNGPVSWWHNREYRPQDAGYTEDLITQHAREFIRANREKPFFCYVPFHIVHAPLQAKDEDVEKVDAQVTDKTKRTYAAMVQSMDKNVATILGDLDSLGLRENTIVIFASDNGGTKDGCNLPLRGGKHTLYEGGVHLPAAVYWPRGGLTGGKNWTGLCGFMELFPTLMDMAGLKMPETRPLDGKNIWPALRSGSASPVENYYWAWTNCDAIRTADWKMLRYFNHNELYDIRKDISESTNLADAHPDVVKTLTAKMDGWVVSTGAALAHQPANPRLNAKAAPEGEVLEITATATNVAKARDQIVVPFGVCEGGRVLATDYVEYDLATAKESLQTGFYYSPFKGPHETPDIEFKRGTGIDQFGREQIMGPAPKGGPGVWEHRMMGACSSSPGWMPRHGLVFTGAKPGAFKVYIDNVRIRHIDGTTTPIWCSGTDTRPKKIADSAQFKDVNVRAIPLSEVEAAFKK